MDRRQFLVAAGASTILPTAGCAPGEADDYAQAAQAIRDLPRTMPELGQMVRIATLAPNGHNTQPWLFDVGAGRISIHPDLTRRTAVVDPDDHHLYVSLGCAAETLAVAGDALGNPTDITFDPSGDGQIDIAFTPGAVLNSDLYPAIARRQSTRAPFDGTGVTAATMQDLEQAAKMEGVSVAFFLGETYKQQITDFVVEGNTAQLHDAAFVAELRDWIRFNPDEAIHKGDGLFTSCSGNPVLPTWIGQNLFNFFISAETENEKYRQQILSSAGVAVFTAENEGPEGWIQVGRSFQRFALKLTALGLLHSHINQPVEDLQVRPNFAAWLGAPDKRPDLVIRFGRGEALPYSMRRPVRDVIAT